MYTPQIQFNYYIAPTSLSNKHFVLQLPKKLILILITPQQYLTLTGFPSPSLFLLRLLNEAFLKKSEIRF